MIRFLWLGLLNFFILTEVFPQQPNDWINYEQDYYRIPVAKEGIYRITSAQLRERGFPPEANASLIQIFHRGNEQAIHVNDGGDGSFEANDYIEFFGMKNDARSDAPLYQPGVVQHNPFHALFSDTTSYFVTLGSAPGKRMEQLSEFDGNTPVVGFHYDEKQLVYGDSYAWGQSERDEAYSSAFETGEGWTSTPIRQGQFRDFQVQGIVRTETGGPPPLLELMLVGRNATTHTVEIRVGPSQRLLPVSSLLPFEPFKVNETLDWSDVAPDGTLTVRVSVPNRGYNDQVSVSYLRFRYPQATDALNLSEKIFNIPAGDPVVNLMVQNTPPGTVFFDVTDMAQIRRYSVTVASTSNATLRYAQEGLRIFASSIFNVPSKIDRVDFREILPSSYNYIIITHPLLRRPAGGYTDPVLAYADYRASEQGGAYKPIVVNVDELFNQFNFGEKSPLAIYRFLQFMTASGSPSYLFLIGKGLEFHQKYYRTANAGTWPQQDLVPTGGAPGSDAIFTMGLGGNPAEGIPTGRLPAMSASHVSAYLNKIVEMEAAPFDGLWRKKILHLSGGIESWEPELFKRYLEEFQQIAEGPFLGGSVDAIAKQSREVQTINIAEQVNNGLGLITFFGHSSTSTLDFDIGYVTNRVMGYNNKGRYPMLLMNGCEVGAFFLRRMLFGEDWILAADLGASAFIGHNAYASANNLYRYSKSFYGVAYADSLLINRGIGDIKSETGRRFLSDAEPSIGTRSQVEQMILLGDPAARLFGASQPDFEINENQVRLEGFHGEPVTIASDSFALRFVVRNFGRADRRSYRVEVRRTYSDNSFHVYDSIYQTPVNTDTLYFIIRNTPSSKPGTNHFALQLDADEIIDELNETNNRAEINFFIPGNGTRNLYPVNYAIVHDPSVRFTIQATDVFSGERGFLFEIDTVNTFDSPFRKQHSLNGEVLFSHVLDLPLKDSVAYYWRTRLQEPGPGENDQWTTSTFTFIDDSPDGWAQVHFPQFLEDGIHGLEFIEGSRRIAFLKSETPVDILTFGASAGKPRDSVSVRIAGQEYNLYTQGFGCRMNTINLIAFDRRSTTPYVGVYLKWYEIDGSRRSLCGREPFVINSFMYNEVSTGKNDLIAYVNNVAEGDSVVLYTMGNANFGLWPDDAKAKLGELGISLEQFSEFVAGEPVVIFARKGSSPGTARVFRHAGENPQSSRLKVSQSITGGFDSGYVSSPLIGPAYHWDQLAFTVNEAETSDEIRVEIRGVKLNREEVTVANDVSMPLSLNNIDPNEFPYLRLIFHASDKTLLTAAQLAKWIVLFTPVPEGVLIPENRSREVSEIQEGDVYRQAFNFINISGHEFRDSLTVQSSFSNTTTGVGDRMLQKIVKPAAGDTTRFEIERNTKGYAGWNDVHVFVNPRLHPEQYYDNNLVLLQNNAHVIVDRISPVTEVTFDGKLIEDGDFVSPQPRIRVSITDENPFIFRTDTTGIRIFLTSPCQDAPCEPQYISFSRADVKWDSYPELRKFTVDFNPELIDGTYLLSVESADAAGNKSEEPYTISFRVINETMVVFDPPHPNPMSAGTEFTYTVSGTEAPVKSRLEILDLSGRLIYSVQTMDDLTIGRNRLFWDGTDQQGNSVADGLYVYRMKARAGNLEREIKGKIVVRR